MDTPDSTTAKPVPKKRDQSKRRAGYQPKMSVNGRPGKRTPQLEKDLLEAISRAAPYRIACASVGISEDTFTEWRRKDPAFARRVEQAAGRSAVKMLERIREHGEESFSPLAWILERRFPESFSRPEVQLNLQTNIHNDNRQFTISVQAAEVMESRVLEVEGEMGDLFGGRLPPSSAESGT